MTVINGTNGNDVLQGSSLSGDVINGFEGNDRIIAGPGNDVITAGNGNNELVTGSGTDVIVAGNGLNSFFYGENLMFPYGGNAVLSAGSGTNFFVINPNPLATPSGGGKLWIAGFHGGPNSDFIQLGGFPNIHSFADLQPFLSISGSNTVIDLSSDLGLPPGSQVITILNDTNVTAGEFTFQSKPSTFFATATETGSGNDTSSVNHMSAASSLLLLEGLSHGGADASNSAEVSGMHLL